jgi:hypothetical protein
VPNHIKAEALRDFIRLTKKGNSRKNKYDELLSYGVGSRRLYKLQKGCTRLAAASDKVYQLLAHGRWFSPGTPASSTTKPGKTYTLKSLSVRNPCKI